MGDRCPDIIAHCINIIKEVISDGVFGSDNNVVNAVDQVGSYLICQYVGLVRVGNRIV